MARNRMIKPEYWDDAEVAEVSLQANLLFIGMWNFADDKGVIENTPTWIKSKVFPRRKNLREEQVCQWLEELEKARFLVPFQHKNKGYYVIRTFGVHQKIDKPGPSKIPQSVIQQALSIFDEQSSNGSRTVDDHSLPKEEEKGSKEEGEDEEKKEPPPNQFGDVISKNITELMNDCLKDQVYFVEHLCRQTGLQPDKVPKYMQAFNDYLQSLGVTVKTVVDYRKHAQNWIKKQPGAQNTTNGSQVKIKVK